MGLGPKTPPRRERVRRMGDPPPQTSPTSRTTTQRTSPLLLSCRDTHLPAGLQTGKLPKIPDPSSAPRANHGRGQKDGTVNHNLL